MKFWIIEIHLINHIRKYITEVNGILFYKSDHITENRQITNMIRSFNLKIICEMYVSDDYSQIDIHDDQMKVRLNITLHFFISIIYIFRLWIKRAEQNMGNYPALTSAMPFKGVLGDNGYNSCKTKISRQKWLVWFYFILFNLPACHILFVNTVENTINRY